MHRRGRRQDEEDSRPSHHEVGLGEGLVVWGWRRGTTMFTASTPFVVFSLALVVFSLPHTYIYCASCTVRLFYQKSIYLSIYP